MGGGRDFPPEISGELLDETGPRDHSLVEKAAPPERGGLVLSGGPKDAVDETVVKNSALDGVGERGALRRVVMPCLLDKLAEPRRARFHGSDIRSIAINRN